MNEKNLQLIQEGNFEKLLTSNRRYIHKVIQNLWKEEDPMQQQDLYQIGYIAYWKAFNNYNQEISPIFNSFAAVYIRNDIKGYLNQFGSTVKVGRTTREREGDNLKKTISTQTLINEDQILEDNLTTDYFENNYDNTQEVNTDVLRHFISKLKPRYQELLLMRYTKDMTLIEIGDELNISREAVRQQIDKALIKIRKLMGVELEEKVTHQRTKEWNHRLL